jgi:hypothetical protein
MSNKTSPMLLAALLLALPPLGCQEAHPELQVTSKVIEEGDPLHVAITPSPARSYWLTVSPAGVRDAQPVLRTELSRDATSHVVRDLAPGTYEVRLEGKASPRASKVIHRARVRVEPRPLDGRENSP